MKRAMLVGGVCFLLGAISFAFGATAIRPDQFVALAWNWTATQTFDTSHTITGLPSPSGSSDAASKGYVDAQIIASGSGTVTSITCNAGLTGGTITASGTCALDLTSANEWSGVQTFDDGKLVAKGASSGSATIKAPATGGGTATLPAGSGTLVYSSGTGTVTSIICGTGLSGGTITSTGTCAIDLTHANTWTGVQSFGDGDVSLNGSSSGNTVLKASAAAGGTITFPAVTDTAAVLGTAQTWTATQSSAPQTLTISTATFTPAVAAGNNIKLTLVHASCPCTFANWSGTPIAGTSGVLEVIQSATGSDTIGTWGSQYVSAGGTSTLALSTAANAIDFFSYYVIDSTHTLITSAALNATH